MRGKGGFCGRLEAGTERVCAKKPFALVEIEGYSVLGCNTCSHFFRRTGSRVAKLLRIPEVEEHRNGIWVRESKRES